MLSQASFAELGLGLSLAIKKCGWFRKFLDQKILSNSSLSPKLRLGVVKLQSKSKTQTWSWGSKFFGGKIFWGQQFVGGQNFWRSKFFWVQIEDFHQIFNSKLN